MEYIRLLAPAGAGKTASLLYRCVKAVKDDPSRRVLIVTFTRVARAVLQERITNAPEFSNLRGRVEVATLNFLEYKVVKFEQGEKGTGKACSLLLSYRQARVYQTALMAGESAPGTMPPKSRAKKLPESSASASKNG
ncbi:UvrD-helicase domain-containing protein [Treponema endosymbiont of Eucomonympha sp.]|uniref:UvrD-helicase domain-containing protein n=1 Tax=Treponema endosymbiont of Eucomonympha sp. TaxID=1580831 RepID=UPI0016501BD3